MPGQGGRYGNLVLIRSTCEFLVHAEGIFGWVTVVSFAVPRGDETVALVKAARGEVGFAKLEEDSRDCRAEEFVEGSAEKRRGDALAAKLGVDGDIQDFRFVSGLASGHEADYRIIYSADQNNSALR